MPRMLVHLAVAIAVDNRPHPVHVVGHLGIDAKLIALGASIAERGDAKYGPRMVRLRGVPTQEWTS